MGRGTVINGSHPGPLIKATKVRRCTHTSEDNGWKSRQGDFMQINVVNNLSDNTLFRSTSIVCFSPSPCLTVVLMIRVKHSTGMECTNTRPTGLMELLVSTNAQSRQTNRSCTNSLQPIRLVPFGIIPTIVSHSIHLVLYRAAKASGRHSILRWSPWAPRYIRPWGSFPPNVRRWRRCVTFPFLHAWSNTP